MVIGPRYRDAHLSPNSKPSKYFDKRANLLTLKRNHFIVGEEVVIPMGETLFVDSDATIKFGKLGCLKVYGDLVISKKASLSLLPEHQSEGWSGVHFFNGNDREINHLHVEGVGYGKYGVTCGQSKFSGGVSFYNSKVLINDSEILNSHIENAVHFVNSEVDTKSLTIEKSQSDCLDSDYSVLRLSNSKFKSCGGDGVDVSGSLFTMNDSELSHNTDKSISVGENSNGYINGSRIFESDIGIASKDGSIVHISNSFLENNRVGIATYSKKPYFPDSKIDFDESQKFVGNRINATLEGNQTSDSNRIKK